MAQSTSSISAQAAYQWGAASLFAAAVIILLALAFEHVGGYEPCPLCLQQRYAYYAGIPALFISLILISLEQHRTATILFFLTAIGFLLNSGLGTYHAGVEWKFWEGPATCDTNVLKPLAPGGSGLLHDLSTKSFASCGDATWRFLGLSFAGWNVLICIALTIGCLKAAFAAGESRA
ncbi:MAG: disulfide bond formation protein B [Hyphomicrobiaceae bacterium]